MIQLEGWVKLYRQFYTGRISNKPSHYREIFIWLVVNANHKPHRISGRIIERGQIFVTYEGICEALHWFVGARKERYERHHVEKAMKWFRDEGMIVSNPSVRGTVVTICNYDLYQDEGLLSSASKEPSTAVGKLGKGLALNKNERNKEKDISIVDSKSNKIPFEIFWNAYDKKVGCKTKIAKKWLKLSLKVQKLIMEFIPKYKEAQPKKQFRKNPDAFLNNTTWEDELISNANETKKDLSVIKF